MAHLQHNKKILNRIKRLQGQIKSIELAFNTEDSSCIELLQQVAAIKGAINGLMNELIGLHLRHHVLADQESVPDEEIEQLLALLKRYT